MALPPVASRRDSISLISPVDGAIDFEALPDPITSEQEKAGEGPTWFQLYSRGRNPGGVGELPLHDDVEPTRFEVRPLTERERSVARALSGLGEDDDREARILASTAYLGWCVRLGLVSVTGWEGWDFRRETHCGLRCWPADALDGMDSVTSGFLALTIHEMSVLPLVSAAPSGS